MNAPVERTTTIERACEVLHAEGYDDAAKYLRLWSDLPADLRAVYPPRPADARREQFQTEGAAR